MKTFTHEQVQEILRSAEEAPDYDRAGLADHLSECADCRSYAALVDRTGPGSAGHDSCTIFIKARNSSRSLALHNPG